MKSSVSPSFSETLQLYKKMHNARSSKCLASVSAWRAQGFGRWPTASLATTLRDHQSLAACPVPQAVPSNLSTKPRLCYVGHANAGLCFLGHKAVCMRTREGTKVSLLFGTAFLKYYGDVAGAGDGMSPDKTMYGSWLEVRQR